MFFSSFPPSPLMLQSSPEVLASSVLAEVPQQLVEYMTKNKLVPPNSAHH